MPGPVLGTLWLIQSSNDGGYSYPHFIDEDPEQGQRGKVALPEVYTSSEHPVPLRLSDARAPRTMSQELPWAAESAAEERSKRGPEEAQARLQWSRGGGLPQGAAL